MTSPFSSRLATIHPTVVRAMANGSEHHVLQLGDTNPLYLFDEKCHRDLRGAAYQVAGTVIKLADQFVAVFGENGFFEVVVQDDRGKGAVLHGWRMLLHYF